MNLIVIILMFGVIIFVHEFGHFIVAKLNHVAVLEFSIGMGPAIVQWERKDTLYSLRALPMGGYCMMDGDMENSDNPNALNNKPVLTRLMVLMAGPLFNFLLAFVLSIIICHYYAIDPAEINYVAENSAAEEAGLQAGDLITELNGQRICNFREITIFRMVENPKKPVEVTYIRDGEKHKTTVQLKYDEASGSYMFGISAKDRKARNVGEELKFSFYEVRYNIKAVIASLRMIFKGKAGKDSLMGPVGIGQVMNDVIEDAKEDAKKPGGSYLYVFLNIINFVVLISANIGMMNLLPIPGLDGGRIIFVLFEAIAGRPVPKEKEMAVTAVGVLLLVMLMMFVYFNDITRLFH